MLDFLFTRYNDISYLMSMEHVSGFRLITKGYEKAEEEKLYQKWLSDYARFEITFDEYVKKHKPYTKTSEKEKEEILKRWGGGV